MRMVLLVFCFWGLLSADEWKHYAVSQDFFEDGKVPFQNYVKIDSLNNKIWTSKFCLNIATGQLDSIPYNILNRIDISLDTSGDVWIAGHNKGLISYVNNSWKFHTFDSTLFGFYSVVVDREKNVWFLEGTFGRYALYKSADGSTYERVDTPLHIEKLSVTTTGTVCIIGIDKKSASNENGYRACYFMDGKWISHKVPLTTNGDSDYYVQDITIDKSNSLWLTFRHSFEDSLGGIYRMDTTYKWKSATLRDGLPTLKINDIAFDSKEQIWIGTDLGLYSSLNGSSWKHWSDADWGGFGKDLYYQNKVSTVQVDNKDNVWISSYGIHCLQQNNTSIVKDANVVLKENLNIMCDGKQLSISNSNILKLGSTISIYNAFGRQLYLSSIKKSNSIFNMNVNLPKGMYVLTLEGTKRISKSFIVQ